MATADGSSGSASSGGAGSTSNAVMAPPAAKTWTTDARDSCIWYAGVPCDRPRTCFDCLNVLLPGSECVVDPGGACITITDYESVRSVYPPSYSFYASAAYTYCAASDASCAACRQGWLNGSLPAFTSSCLGADGCVCIASCELPGRDASVLERARCAASAPGNSLNKLLTALGLALAMCAVFTAIAFAVRHVVRFLEARGDALRLEQLRARRRPRRVPSGPPLALDGWKAMREELVTKERVHLAGGSAVALVAEVEEGDGFRPLSPSQMHEQ